MSDTAEGATKGGNLLRYGCFGCLGVIGFALICMVGVAGMAYMQVRNEEVAKETERPDLPAGALPVAGGSQGGGTSGAVGAMPDERPQATRGAARSAETVAGTVILDLTQGEFEVVPGQPGEGLSVDATYDRKSYVLEKTLDATDDGSWTYTVRFRRTSGGSGLGLFDAIKRMLGGSRPSVRVTLPADQFLDLQVNMAQGGTRMDLGGLWLREAEIEFAQGGFQLRVSEPLQMPMERLTIDGRMGGFDASHLGNASPKTLDVDFTMGGMSLDLRGAWAADADISIKTSMSGGVVRVPDDVIIEGLSVPGRPANPSAELQPPTLHFSSSSSMGDLQFR
ncbi:MAG: hypothetical protein ACE5IK_10020 [Acidobacteriota bacterium]